MPRETGERRGKVYDVGTDMSRKVPSTSVQSVGYQSRRMRRTWGVLPSTRGAVREVIAHLSIHSVVCIVPSRMGTRYNQKEQCVPARIEHPRTGVRERCSFVPATISNIRLNDARVGGGDLVQLRKQDRG